MMVSMRNKMATEEFAQKVNDRFDEVIARTQVVDGTLMRSQLMRSSDRKNVSVSAFMAEPTKSYNMFLRDYIDITQGKREGKKIRPADLKHLSRTAAVYLVTNVANAVMQSIFDAERDDDDDKSYIEKVCADGAEIAYKVSQRILRKVYKKVGLVPRG